MTLIVGTRPEIIDTVELARRLGVKPSWIKEHVRDRAKEKLPFIKIGRLVRFDWNKVLEWMKSQERGGDVA